MSVINGKRILIVDDELGMRESLHMILKPLGAFTVKAESGEDALVILKHNTFDLITTCLRMEGMNGIDLITEIKVRNIKAPVIVITGYKTLEVMTACNRLGIVDFIGKPINVQDTIRCIEKALENTSKDQI